MSTKKTANAGELLRKRYRIPQWRIGIERVQADLACAMYDARKARGWTQKELARRAGTTQSVVSRIEAADYEGRTINHVVRLVYAMGLRLEIRLKRPRETAR